MTKKLETESTDNDVVVEVTKLTTPELLLKAAACTSGSPCTAPLGRWYDSEDSPIRTQLFYVAMRRIPSFVSTHLVRHKIGVEHFVRSNREDRGGDPNANRWTPVNHDMLINAEALLSMAHARLCFKASKETRQVMRAIQLQVQDVDPELSQRMVPLCVYRGGICHRFSSAQCPVKLSARRLALTPPASNT